LIVEYDPARLAPGDNTSTANTDVLCHVRFQPIGETRTESVLEHAPSFVGAHAAPRPAVLELPVPLGTTEVELWFERRAPAGTSAWDSRYGQNYTFGVSPEGLPIPMRSVALRPDSLVDLDQVRVAEDTATKEDAKLGMSVRTLLVIRAVTEDPDGSDDTWADVHVFDASGDVIHAGTVVFEQLKGSADPATRVLDDEVYGGSGGGSGMGAWSRPDAHTVQYRLYCECAGQVFTDGVLHQFEVPADEDVRHGTRGATG